MDSFYLWRKGGQDTFWKAVEGGDADARTMLLDALRKNTTGDPERLAGCYMAHIRRFRQFLASDGTVEGEKEQPATLAQQTTPAQPVMPTQSAKPATPVQTAIPKQPAVSV